MYEPRWYECRLEDRSEIQEPDWSRVPEAKREAVRARWSAQQQGEVSTVMLWGPQIPFFSRQPYYRVTVLS